MPPSSILSKGLSCSDSDKKHSHASVKPNIPHAARYYCRGLEYENARSDRELQAERDEARIDVGDPLAVISEDAGNLVAQLNTEVVQDIAHGLCMLYRHGKIRPEHEHEAELHTELKQNKSPSPPMPFRKSSSRSASWKGKEKSIDLTEKEGAVHDRKPSTRSQRKSSSQHRASTSSTWARGGRLATPLISKLERLLGLVFPDFLENADEPLTEEPESIVDTSSPPALESRHTSPDPVVSVPPSKRANTSASTAPVDVFKKSVSFSQLPPRHRALTAGAVSLLDVVSSRQARSALVHLWYIIALCAFADGDARAAGKLWEKITVLGKEQGSGSKEADEIVEKASIRLGMLAADSTPGSKDMSDAAAAPAAAAAAAGHQSEVQAKLSMVKTTEQLSLHHLLSPVDGHGHAKETTGFDFGAIGAKANAQTTGGANTTSDATSQHKDFAKAVADAHGPPSSSAPEPTRNRFTQQQQHLLRPPPPAGPAPTRRQSSKPKFALHDSPTSIRSGRTGGNDGLDLSSPTKRSNGAARAARSNVSLLSASKQQAGGGIKQKAPWLVRSPSSSTSISGVDVGGPSSSGSGLRSSTSTAVGSRADVGLRPPGRTGLLLPSAAPSNRQAFQPLFRGAAASVPRSRSRLGPQAAPSLALSDTSTSNLGYIPPSVSSDYDLRRNASSVASLPHYSTRDGSTLNRRGQSAAHLLLARSQASNASVNHQQREYLPFARRGREGSSSSLASLASFASLSGVQKSFSSLRNFFSAPTAAAPDDASSILEEEAAVPDATAALRSRLKATAEKHDAAVAELEAQETEWGYVYQTYFHSGQEEEDTYGDEVEDPEESPAPPSFDSSTKFATTTASAAKRSTEPVPYAAGPVTHSTPPKAVPAAAVIPGSTDSSGRKSLRFSTSIPSSSLLLPTRRISNQGSAAPAPASAAALSSPAAALPNGNGALHTGSPKGKQQQLSSSPSPARQQRLARRPRDFRSREFFERDPTSASITPTASQGNLRAITAADDLDEHSSGSQTPLNAGRSRRSGSLKVDPLLAALEAASRVNVKSRCAICGKAGVNFPKCQKCGMTFCSRDCRIASGGDEGIRLGKHVC